MTPLTGRRVMEIGSFIAVPYATALLAGLGAEVIKIEPIPSGDPFRRGQDATDPYFAQYNAGKKSLALNLKSDAGRGVLHALLGTADALVHNLRPGKEVALGLGHDQLADRHPHLVHAAVSGFGDIGPMVHRPGYDSAAQSMSGLYSVLASDGEAQAPGLPLADLTTGVVAAVGICAQLAHRARSGSGGAVDTSLLEVATMLATEYMAYEAPDLGRPVPPASVRSHTFTVTCRDRVSLLVSLGSAPGPWRGLRALAAESRAADSDAVVAIVDRSSTVRAASRNIIADWLNQHLSSRTSGEALRQLRAHHVPAAVIRSYTAALDESEDYCDQVVQTVPGPGIDLVRPGVRFDGELPARTPTVARVGEHTRQLLAELGRVDDLDRLVAEGVAYQAADLTLPT